MDQYFIAQGVNLMELMGEVNAMYEKGYIAHGSIGMVEETNEEYPIFYQAMIIKK